VGFWASTQKVKSFESSRLTRY